MEKLIVGPSSRDVVDLDAPVRFNLRAIAQSLGPPRRGPGGHRARPAAAREADRRHPRHRRAHPPDRRRRPVGRHHRRRHRQRRPRRDGHRRRARGRAHGGGDALPGRRDLRAAGGGHAGARGPLPLDGHHRLQAHLQVEGPRAGQEHRVRRHRRHRRHADEGRALLRRRHPHGVAGDADAPAPHPLRRQHPPGRKRRTAASRSGSEGFGLQASGFGYGRARLAPQPGGADDRVVRRASPASRW